MLPQKRHNQFYQEGITDKGVPYTLAFKNKSGAKWRFILSVEGRKNEEYELSYGLPTKQDVVRFLLGLRWSIYNNGSSFSLEQFEQRVWDASAGYGQYSQLIDRINALSQRQPTAGYTWANGRELRAVDNQSGSVGMYDEEGNLICNTTRTPPEEAPPHYPPVYTDEQANSFPVRSVDIVDRYWSEFSEREQEAVAVAREERFHNTEMDTISDRLREISEDLHEASNNPIYRHPISVEETVQESRRHFNVQSTDWALSTMSPGMQQRISDEMIRQFISLTPTNNDNASNTDSNTNEPPEEEAVL